LIFIKVSSAKVGHSVCMQRMVQTLFCLLLALALVLSGPGAMGPATGATMVVLCGGDTPTTLWLDAKGNPIDPGMSSHKCPHCLVFDAPSADAPALRMFLETLPVPSRLVLPVRPQPKSVAHLRPDPRGPPQVLPVGLRQGDPRSKARSLALMAPALLDPCQATPAAPAGDLRANF
jgi:hypothetical protein